MVSKLEPQCCTFAGGVLPVCWALTPEILGFSSIHVEKAGILGMLCGGSTQLDEEKLSRALDVGGVEQILPTLASHRGELPQGLPKEM